MADQQDVAFLHDVVFPFEAQPTGAPGFGVPPGLDQPLPVDGFGADEFFFEIGVNCSRRFAGGSVLRDAPGTHLVFRSGQERDHAQKGIRGADQPVQSRFAEPVAFEVGESFFFGQLGDFRLDASTDGGDGGVLPATQPLASVLLFGFM